MEVRERGLGSPFQTPESVSGSGVQWKSEVWAGPKPHAEQKAENWKSELRAAKEAEFKGKFKQELVEILWGDKVGDQGIVGQLSTHPTAKHLFKTESLPCWS